MDELRTPFHRARKFINECVDSSARSVAGFEQSDGVTPIAQRPGCNQAADTCTDNYYAAHKLFILVIINLLPGEIDS